MSREPQKKHRNFPWIRLIITVVVLLFVVVIVVFNIQGTAILAVLGVLFALCQWLFPLPASKQEPSVDTPSGQPRNSLSTTTTARDAGGSTLTTIDKPSPSERPVLDAIEVRPDSVFLFNEPLTDPNEFYGRIRERKTLINRTIKGASTSIVGSRRIGKTWLIAYLRLVEPTALGPHFRIGYVDATMASCTTVAGFTAKALEALNIHTFVPDQASLGLSMLEKVVQDLKSKNQTPILCIDEFEGMSDQQEFNLNFFNSLRAMTQAGLGLVVASKKPLIDVVGDIGKTSGFFNVFEQLTLRPFNVEEAEAFVRAKGDVAGFTDREQALLLKYGQKGEQYWPPIRLQLVGKMLLEDKNLAPGEGSVYYRPDDSKYWQDFEERLEEKYRGVVR